MHPNERRLAMESFDREALARLGTAARELNQNSGLHTNQASPSMARGARTGARAPAGPTPALWLATRVLGAAAVLAVGAIHLHEYNQIYSGIPTIGTLFVLNFAGATGIGLGLLAPLERLVGRRWGGDAVALLAIAGIGLAATAFVFLTVAEHTPLFGFMEPGYDPTGILVSRLAEGAAVLLLGGYLAARLTGASVARW
jgi:hypothetical protein